MAWLPLSSALGAGGIEDLLKLPEGLTRRICDDSVVSRAPSLEALTAAESAGQSKRAPPAEAPRYFLIRFAVGDLGDHPEARLISFLLEDSASLLARDSRVAISDAERRRLSLEVCAASVTPGGLQKFRRERPRALLEAQPAKSLAEGQRLLAALGAGGGIGVLVEDRDGRFGKVEDERWLAAGWIQPHETIEARVRERRYRRIVQPVSRATRVILVLPARSDASPVATLQVSDQAPEPFATWVAAWAPNDHWKGRQRELDLWRLESGAFLRLEQAGASGGSVDLRTRWESAKGALERAYAGAATAGSQGDRERWRSVLGTGFVEALSRARVNQSRARAVLYAPLVEAEKILKEWEN